MLRAFFLTVAIHLLPLTAAAEVALSFYGGAQAAQPSDVTIRDPVIGAVSAGIDWEGRSFDAPVYYGLRATKWRTAAFGIGVDFTHNKVYATDETFPDGFDVLEFTDGLNTLTVNAYRRWAGVLGDVSPYVGGGIGLSFPHVEVTSGLSNTSGYQVTGPAATWIAGASVPINAQWSVFGEYKGTYSVNTTDLESGGTLETDIITNAVNVGVSFNF